MITVTRKAHRLRVVALTVMAATIPVNTLHVVRNLSDDPWYAVACAAMVGACVAGCVLTFIIIKGSCVIGRDDTDPSPSPSPESQWDAVAVRCKGCGLTARLRWPADSANGPCQRCGGDLMITAFGTHKGAAARRHGGQRTIQ